MLGSKERRMRDMEQFLSELGAPLDLQGNDLEHAPELIAQVASAYLSVSLAACKIDISQLSVHEQVRVGAIGSFLCDYFAYKLETEAEEPTARMACHLLMRSNPRLTDLHSESELIDALSDTLESFMMACESALDEMFMQDPGLGAKLTFFAHDIVFNQDEVIFTASLGLFKALVRGGEPEHAD